MMLQVTNSSPFLGLMWLFCTRTWRNLQGPSQEEAGAIKPLASKMCHLVLHVPGWAQQKAAAPSLGGDTGGTKDSSHISTRSPNETAPGMKTPPVLLRSGSRQECSPDYFSLRDFIHIRSRRVSAANHQWAGFVWNVV